MVRHAMWATADPRILLLSSEVSFSITDPSHIVAGSLTPPEKINGDPGAMATSSPLSITTMTQAIPAPPSPISTPSPLYASNSYVDRGWVNQDQSAKSFLTQG